MNDIIAVTPTNVYDTDKMKYLLASAKNNNFNIEIIGLNQHFSWINRMLWFQDFLKKLPAETNPIICFTDAYDVFYVDSLEMIKDKFLAFGASIVWSVEKWYSHQLGSDKFFYDAMGDNKPGYKYVNGGTFIGYKKNLLELFTDILDISLKDATFINELKQEIGKYDNYAVMGNDQTWISHHLAKHWDKYNIKLDYECEFFYLPCGDWDDIDQYINQDLIITDTGKKSSIIHVPGKPFSEFILIKLFNYKYNPLNITPLDNKKYSWQNNSITFLENGQMDAFGSGTYTQEKTFTFKAKFGSKAHLLVFNHDYTEFISTRMSDGEIIKGALIDLTS